MLNKKKPAGKRYASRLRQNTLEDDQLYAYKGLTNFLKNGKGRFAKLDGKAGTGKTYLNSVLVESLLVENTLARIAMCAPTHKAVKVLRDQCDYYHERLGFLTIQSLLGVEHSIDQWGKEVFKPTFEGSKVKDYSIIICDEYSMLADELVDALHQHKSVKVIFVGDINQIPPVGLQETKIARPEVIEEWSIEEYKLTKIRRQAEGNPIIQLSLDIMADRYRKPFTNILDDGTGVEAVFTRECDPEYVIDLLTKYFVSPKFAADSDYVKVLAWTNKIVNAMNDHIRYMLYGEDAQNKIVLGEKLIADKPIKEDGKTIFNTNQEFEVINFYLNTLTIGGDGEHSLDLKHYVVDVDYYTNSGRLFTYPIKILHEDSQEDFDTVSKYLKDIAINAKANGLEDWQRKQAWKDYYQFQELFARIKYNYAITAHKSQGSTYDNVFVLSSDIYRNSDEDSRRKIFYTAITRAKNKLYVLTN